MAEFNNTNTTNFFKPSTDGIPLFNDDTMLKISYYDTSIRFEIRKRNMDGKYPSPKPGEANDILINAEKAAILYMMIEEFDKKLIQYNEDFLNGVDCSQYKEYSISVFTGLQPEKTRVLQISTGTVTDHGFAPEIRIHIGVDENRIAKSTFVFKTKMAPVLENYDWLTGEVDTKMKPGQYEIIDMAIRSYMNALPKAINHFNKTVINDERLSKSEKYITAIAERLNVSLPEYNSNNYGGGNSAFDSFSSNNTPAPVVENGGDLGTLLGTSNIY